MQLQTDYIMKTKTKDCIERKVDVTLVFDEQPILNAHNLSKGKSPTRK